MRIDTARNQVGDAVDLLERVLLELNDLHVLAYERIVAVGELNQRVAGGTRDYALDTHGDPRVRDAYRQFSDSVHGAAGDITDAAHGLLKKLKDGEMGIRRTPRTVSAGELAAVIAAQGRRMQRGEYAPHRNEHQAGIDQAVKAAMDQVQRLERENARLTKKLDETTRQLASRSKTSGRGTLDSVGSH